MCWWSEVEGSGEDRSLQGDPQLGCGTVPTTAHARAVDVTYAMLSKYEDKRRAEGAKPATIRYELVVFGRMFSLAVKEAMLTTKPLLPTIRTQPSSG